MLDILFWVAVGVVVGWHVPTPVWATKFFDWVKTWF